MTYHPTPGTWRCADCQRDDRLWRARGSCDGPIADIVGGVDGVIDAEVAIGPDAHLGRFRRCPVAIARQNRARINQALTDYAIAKRLGIQPQTTSPEMLLAVDIEICKIESIERDQQRKIAESRQRAARSRHGQGGFQH